MEYQERDQFVIYYVGKRPQAPVGEIVENPLMYFGAAHKRFLVAGAGLPVNELADLLVAILCVFGIDLIKVGFRGFDKLDFIVDIADSPSL
jgi:hypothetical protein